MPTKNISKIRIRDFSCSWKSTTLGWMKDVDLSGLKVKMIEKKIEEIGDIVVDHVIIGLEGTIKTVLKQVDLTALRQVIPWAPASPDPIPLIPATQYTQCYASAGLLNIHPRDVADTTEDVNLIKAYPSMIVMPKASQGKDFADITIEWTPYPDQTQIVADPPLLVYGYIGDVPA